jgi:hippurate hydrolase
MDESWRFEAHALIRRVATHTAQALGADADVDIVVGYPALYNHPDETDFVRRAAIDYVGADRVIDLDQWYASEDFAWFLKELPGSFYRVGTGNKEKGIVHGLHTPYFTIDEDALRTAPGFMAYLAWKYTSSSTAPE